MTDIGEKVAITPIKSEAAPEYHFSQLQICFPNGKPFITSENIIISSVIDGEERPSQTNFDAEVNHSTLEPGTKVKFNIEENIDDEIAETRKEIKGALDVIIAQEQEEQARLNKEFYDDSLLGRGGQLFGSFMGGVADGAMSLFEFVGDTAEFVVDAAWYNIQVSLVNNLEAAWETLYKNGDVTDFFDSVKEKDIEDFSKAFGTTPKKLAEQFTTAYHIFAFICDDKPTWEMLTDFAVDYAKAQSITEVANMAGSAAFDIVLSAILAITTGGAGNVAQAAQVGAKIKHLGYFQKLAQTLVKLVGQLERKLAKKGITGKLDSKTLHKITPPTPKKIKPKRSRRKARHKNRNNQAEKDKPNNSDDLAADSADSLDTPATSSTQGSPTPKDSKEPGKNKQGETCAPDSKTCTGGEPVSLVTGEEMLTLQEFTLPGPLTLNWSRTYKSSNPDNVGLGYGWSHTFAEHIEIAEDQLLFHSNEARIINFALPSLGATARNLSDKLKVYRSGENQFELSSTEPGQKLTKQFQRPPTSGKFLLTRIYDNFNNGFDFSYKKGLLTQVSSQHGDFWHFEYNQQKTLAGITKLDSAGNRKPLAEFLYDQHNDLIEAFDSNGNSERYEYLNHLIQRRTIKSGYNFYFKWDGTDHQARCLEQWGDLIDGKPTYHYKFKWDKAARKVATTDTRGATEVYQFNPHGLPIYHRDAEGGITTTDYDDAGNVTAIKTPNGHYKYFTYDDQNQLIVFADAANNKHEIKRNKDGLITDLYDPLLQRWSRRYDHNGNLIQQTNPLGESLSFSYNKIGLINSVSNASGQSWQYIWNEKGQLTAIRAPNGKHTRYSYNNDGLVKKIVYPDNKTSQFDYDDAGNCIYVEKPDGTHQRFEYNSLGLVTKAIDHAGRATQYAYNGLSQVVRKIDPAGFTLHYHYDGERNLVGLTNQNGERYKLGYDLNERLIEEVGFDGRVQKYRYDAEGYLIGKADLTRDGQQAINKIVFNRDPNGRLLQQAQLTDDGPVLLNKFGYDKLGRMTEAKNASRTLTWAYDPLGRILEEHQDQHIIKHHYAKGGGRTATTLPDGHTIGYDFNEDGLFSGLYYDDECVTKIEHNDSGQEISRQLSNKLNTESRYDPQGRLIAQRTGKYTSDQSFKSISQRILQYNEQGLISQIDDTLRGQTRYHYDALDRLNKVGGPNPENFIHDPAGNILATQTPDNIAQPGQVQGNRLNFHGDSHYAYDELGNRRAATRGKNQSIKTAYYYDALNQLSHINHQGKLTKYTYDALGRRIQKTDGETSTDFLWLGDVLLSETTKQQEEVLEHKTYLFEPGTFKPLAFVQDKQIYHYHLDHLGTPQEITNSSGKLVWAVSYRAYGNLAVAHTNEIENNLRFQGQYFDEESGLHYNRFRYYDPECGRFVNQDPIGLLGGANNYQYVPNPIRWVDPFGLTAKKEDPARQPNSIAAAKPDFYVGPSGAESTMPSTAFRYMGYQNADGSVNKYAQQAIDTKSARLSYFGFEKLETGDAVTEAFQIRAPKHVTPTDPDPAWSDGRLRLEFDTLQLYENGKPRVAVPYSHGGTGSELEPFTSVYTQYGKGGAQQLVPTETIEITADKVDILPPE